MGAISTACCTSRPNLGREQGEICHRHITTSRSNHVWPPRRTGAVRCRCHRWRCLLALCGRAVAPAWTRPAAASGHSHGRHLPGPRTSRQSSPTASAANVRHTRAAATPESPCGTTGADPSLLRWHRRCRCRCRCRQRQPPCSRAAACLQERVRQEAAGCCTLEGARRC